jgi:hypothetical protein
MDNFIFINVKESCVLKLHYLVGWNWDLRLYLPFLFYSIGSLY